MDDESHARTMAASQEKRVQDIENDPELVDTVEKANSVANEDFEQASGARSTRNRRVGHCHACSVLQT